MTKSLAHAMDIIIVIVGAVSFLFLCCSGAHVCFIMFHVMLRIHAPRAAYQTVS